ncbi:MAG: hypothetical protein HYS13_06075 [Planctomycetia bacterium]|nr:hypothetical protein [Planctomycetia bacterium]
MIEKETLVRHVKRCLGIATTGVDEESGFSSEGYLLTLSRKVRGRKTALLQVADELKFAAYLDAALLIGQMMSPPSEMPTRRTPAVGAGPYKIVPAEIPDRYVIVKGSIGARSPAAEVLHGETCALRARLPEVSSKLDKSLAAAGLAKPADADLKAVKEKLLSECGRPLSGSSSSLEDS